MKVLLDECIDRRLARELAGYEVKTVSQIGWAGTKNGRLLTLAAANFDVFITVDRNLPFQQNLEPFDLAVIVLHAPSNRVADLRLLVPQILQTLPIVEPGKAVVVSG